MRNGDQDSSITDNRQLVTTEESSTAEWIRDHVILYGVGSAADHNDGLTDYYADAVQ